jgi:hypothetical protein
VLVGLLVSLLEIGGVLPKGVSFYVALWTVASALMLALLGTPLCIMALWTIWKEIE